MTDLQELGRLADAAMEEAPGDWQACGPSFGDQKPRYLDSVVAVENEDDDSGIVVTNAESGIEESGNALMEYIAAANPATIKSLLAMLAEGAEHVETLAAMVAEKDAEIKLLKRTTVEPANGQ